MTPGRRAVPQPSRRFDDPLTGRIRVVPTGVRSDRPLYLPHDPPNAMDNRGSEKGWSRTGIVWRITTRSGPTRTSLTTLRGTFWRSLIVAVSAVSRSRARKLSRFSANFEVAVPVDQLGVERLDGTFEAGLFGSQVRHPGAQLVDGEEVLLVGLHEPGDGFGGTGQFAFDPGALGGGRVGGAHLGQSTVALSLDERGVGEQAVTCLHTTSSR
jgi:hypothetical protein